METGWLGHVELDSSFPLKEPNLFLPYLYTREVHFLEFENPEVYLELCLCMLRLHVI